MKLNFSRAASACALIAVIILGACAPQQPDSSSAEAFLRDFVGALSANQSERFELFYLRPGDFNAEAQGATLARERFMGTVRQEFLSGCRGAAGFFFGKPVEVAGISMRDDQASVIQFLQDVRDHHSDTTVRLRIAEGEGRMEIREIVKVGGEWRITRFFLVFEHKPEERGRIDIGGDGE